jgi:hypothetical protein
MRDIHYNHFITHSHEASVVQTKCSPNFLKRPGEIILKGKERAILATSSGGFHRFYTQMVVWLRALCARMSPFTLGKIPGTYFYHRLRQRLGHSAAGRVSSIKKIIKLGIEPTTFRFVAQCPNQRILPLLIRRYIKNCG